MNRPFELLILTLILGSTVNVVTAQAQAAEKKHVLPPLASGPTGPLPQLPLDSMSPVPPRVSYRSGELTIVAANSTLSDILSCIRDQTGAEIEIPETNERVVTRLGPGPVRDVLAELLNGSHYNYVLLGSAADKNKLTRVVLLATVGPDLTTPAQRGALRRVLPNQEPRRTNPNEARISEPEGLTNQPDVPSNQEVSPPTEGAVEMTD